MTTSPSEPFGAAEMVAPQPTSRAAGVDDWARHYAALGLAAYAAFRQALGTGAGESLGHLSLLGVTATSAAAALLVNRSEIGNTLWGLTPEAGALNGEWEEWLTATLDALGVNPADIDPGYDPTDWSSPSRRAVAR